ncbi:MAG: glycosyltransferase family 4 protein [Candidatus Jettenia sp.]|nr:glycosyltransferase family 4 protein [Candidatus Jettenia sp.]
MKSKPRILFITHRLELEGAPFSLFFLARGFRKAGFDIEVVSPVDGKLKEYYEKEGIKLHISNFTDPDNQIGFELNFDIYFANTLDSYMFIQRLDPTKEKIVWCIRESEREEHFKQKPYIETATFRNVSRVVFVADATREIYSDLANNNFVTIHNGLDLSGIDKFKQNNSKAEIKKQLGFAQDQKLVTTIGTVSLRKGQLEFAEAAITAIASTNTPCSFLMVGGGVQPQYDEAINRLIKLNNLTDKVKIIPETKEVFKYYLISDIFVCNSYIESFPRVVLEAMAFSLPIIATQVYGITEQLDHKHNGILIQAGDTNALSANIVMLLENHILAHRLGSLARNKVEKEFSEEHMLKQYINLIDTVCAE